MENQIKRHPIFVLLVTFFTAFWMLLAAQDAGGPAQVEVPLGKKMKIKGVIVKRAPDRFTLRDEQGSEITVVPTHQTVIKEKKNNFFRKAINYSTADLLLSLLGFSSDGPEGVIQFQDVTRHRLSVLFKMLLSFIDTGMCFVHTLFDR